MLRIFCSMTLVESPPSSLGSRGLCKRVLYSSSTISARRRISLTSPDQAGHSRIFLELLLTEDINHHSRSSATGKLIKQDTRYAHQVIPSPSTRPPWERASVGARRVKTALTLGTQAGGRRRRSARLARVGGDGVRGHPGARVPRRRRSNRSHSSGPPRATARRGQLGPRRPRPYRSAAGRSASRQHR